VFFTDFFLTERQKNDMIDKIGCILSFFILLEEFLCGATAAEIVKPLSKPIAGGR